MRVALLCRKLDGKPTNGFERYSQNLVSGLEEQGADIFLPNQAASLPIRPSGSIVSPPYFDIILPFWQITTGGMRADVFHAVTDSQAIIFPWLKGKKVVTMHHVDRTPSGSLSETIFRGFYAIGTIISLKYADHIICISQQTKNEVMETYHVSDERITVIPQAIPAAFRPLGKKGDVRTIGYLGALKKRKNVEFAIRSFGIFKEKYRMPDCRLQICGEGPDYPNLIKLTEELGLTDVVRFVGMIPEANILETYNSFDIFVFPSLQEGFGFPILEAQACGVPVLTLKGAMIPEEVVKCAIQCSCEEEMAVKIHDLLVDKENRENVAKMGMDHAAMFSVERMVLSTQRVYERVLPESRTSL